MADTTLGVVDIPIATEEDDSLGLTRYAAALGRFMLECDTPMTVGIQGDWGAGKTSLMNLIEGWLTQQQLRPPPPTLTLNTWQYAQLADGDVLALVVLRALHEKVAGNDQGLAKVWSRMSRAFGRLKAVQVAGVGIEKADDDSTSLADLAELKEAFAKAIAVRLAGGSSDRIVVFIDDLDRILPERAVEILESLKNFVDVPGCIFVLACDYAVVTKGLKKKFDVGEADLGGRSFFDKIIQVPFRMPVYRYEVDRYVRGMLGRIGWSIWKDDVGVYQRLLEYSVGFNPRGLKRLCNTLLLLRMVAEGDENTAELVASDHRLALLFALVCMESAHERLYARLASDGAEENLGLLERALAAEDTEEGEAHDDLTSDELAFLGEVARLIDADGNGKIDEEELRRFLEMLRLAAITSITEEPKRTAKGNYPSAEELIAAGATAGHAPVVATVLQLTEPLKRAGVLRQRTTKGSIAYEAKRRDGRWAPVLYLSPSWKGRGAVISLFTPTMDDLNGGEDWPELRRALEARPGALSSAKGNMVRAPLDDEDWTDRLVERLRALAPFSTV